METRSFVTSLFVKIYSCGIIIAVGEKVLLLCEQLICKYIICQYHEIRTPHYVMQKQTNIKI